MQMKEGLHLANSTSRKRTQMVGADLLLIEGISLKPSEIRSLQRVKRAHTLFILCDYGPPQTKGDRSWRDLWLRWSYVALGDSFRDGRCHGQR